MWLFSNAGQRPKGWLGIADAAFWKIDFCPHLWWTVWFRRSGLASETFIFTVRCFLWFPPANRLGYLRVERHRAWCLGKDCEGGEALFKENTPPLIENLFGSFWLPGLKKIKDLAPWKWPQKLAKLQSQTLFPCRKLACLCLLELLSHFSWLS